METFKKNDLLPAKKRKRLRLVTVEFSLKMPSKPYKIRRLRLVTVTVDVYTLIFFIFYTLIKK